MEYRGYNGTIEVSEQAITITHTGFAAKGAGLVTNVPRKIPLAAISDVFLKPANALVNGHISVGVGGSGAPQSIMSGSADSVVFRKKDNAAFAELHSWLAKWIDHNKAMGVDPTTVEYDKAKPNLAERLDKFSSRLMGVGGENTGPVLAEGPVDSVGTFNSVTLTIYKNGTFIYTGMAEPDRLLGLEVDQDRMRSKSATARGAALLATGGASIVASNNRGVAYLTVIGERTGAKTFTNRNPTTAVLQGHRRLASAAKVLLENSGTSQATAPSRAADEIKALAELRDQGILTEEEFSAKKRQILGLEH